MLNKIRYLRLEARKNKEPITTSILTTLIGECETFGKNAGNREATDTEVIGIIRKFIKNINLCLTADANNKNADVMVHERNILFSLLPKGLSDSELRHNIMKMVQVHNINDKKTIGKVLKELDIEFNGKFDRKIAIDMIKEYVK